MHQKITEVMRDYTGLQQITWDYRRLQKLLSITLHIWDLLKIKCDYHSFLENIWKKMRSIKKP